MSDYSTTTNFTAKDALDTGDPDKVIYGADLQTEYDNIATASATKTDKHAATLGNVIEAGSSGSLVDSGVAAADVADVSEKVVFEKAVTFDGVVVNGNSGSAKTIDWPAGNMQTLVLTADCTLTFTSPVGPCSLTLWVKKSSSYQITWPALCVWPEGVAPVQDAGAEWDVFVFKWSTANYYGGFAQNFS